MWILKTLFGYVKLERFHLSQEAHSRTSGHYWKLSQLYGTPFKIANVCQYNWKTSRKAWQKFDKNLKNHASFIKIFHQITDTVLKYLPTFHVSHNPLHDWRNLIIKIPASTNICPASSVFTRGLTHEEFNFAYDPKWGVQRVTKTPPFGGFSTAYKKL